MARQVLPIVGAIVGAYFGGPQGAQIGYAIGSLVGNAVDPLVVRGPKLGEAGLQTSAEGVFRPIVMGTCAVKGNIICRGNRRIKINRESQGKGTGPITETERVYWTFAIRICEAPESGPINILRIWQDEKLVYDKTPDSQIEAETFEFESRIRIYDGSESQLPDPDLEAFLGAGNVPAYRGTMYAVFPNFDLTDYGERIPDYRWEVSTTTTQFEWDYTWDGPYDFDSPFQVGQAFYSDYWNRFVVCTGAGRKISPDGIQPFIQHGSANIFHGAEHELTHHMFFIESDGTVVVSTDGGNFVTPVYGGIHAAPSANLRYVAEEICFFTMGQNRGYKSNDSGSLWASGEVISGIGTNPKWIKITNGPYICSSQNGIVFESGDGLTWSQLSEISAPSGVLGDLIYEEWTGNIYACYTQGRIYRSVDSAETWELVFETGSGTNYISGFANPDLDTTYICGDGGGINAVYTEDGGDSFVSVIDPNANRWLAFAWAPELATLLGVGAFEFVIGHFDNDETSLHLHDVVSFLGARANLPDARINVEGLDDVVDGIVIADDYSCADAIKTLMPIYNFDATEHDDGTGYKIHFPKRGRPVETTLVIDDFVDIPDKTIRQDAYERPRVLHMAFQSPTTGYAPAKASPSRFSPDVKVVGEISVQVPVSFEDVNEAWQRADIMMKTVWTGIAGEEEFTLPDKFLYLVPSDTVGVSLRGQIRRMLITEQNYENGVLRCKLIADRQGNYTSNLTGVPLPIPTPPPPSIAVPTIHLPLDIPALNDNNDRLLSYHAASGIATPWFGAVVDRSTDGGANFEEILRFNQNSIIGTLVQPVNQASPYYTDTTNNVHVSLFMDSEIESLTQQQFLSEGGSFALSRSDSSGRYWEILQYRDAEQDSGDVWILSNLLRGRLNTESTEHALGEYVVMLETVRSANNIAAHINNDLTYRATSVTRSPDAVPTYTEEYTGQSQREWPVAHLFLDRVGDSINATAIPRHRFGTEDNPIRSINWSSYRWVATDGVNTSTQETIADSTTFNTTGWSTPITVSVAQVNRITGPGPLVSEEIV